MATSGNTTYNRTAEQLVRTAFRHCGMRDSKLTADDLATGLEALNYIILQLRGEQVNLWKISDVTITLVATQADYTIAPSGGDVTAPKPLKILSVRRKNLTTNYETPLNPWALDEYNRQTVKATTGSEPLSYMYQPLRLEGVLKIWPVPTADAVTNYSLIASCAMPLEVMDSLSNDFDIPPEWYMPVGWMLAKELMCDYDVPYNKMNLITANADKYMSDIIDASQENASVYFGMDNSGAR